MLLLTGMESLIHRSQLSFETDLILVRAVIKLTVVLSRRVTLGYPSVGWAAVISMLANVRTY